jgi:hypothetical protein
LESESPRGTSAGQIGISAGRWPQSIHRNAPSGNGRQWWKILCLLNFLYKRCDEFGDLEKKINEGLKDITDDIALGEVGAKCKKLKKALKIVKVTVQVSDRVENLMNSIIARLRQIVYDFQDEDEEAETESEASEKSSLKTISPESPKPETAKALESLEAEPA